MKTRFFPILAVLALLFCAQLWVFGIDTSDTKMLSQPALSKDHIAFVYAGDLWIADRDTSNVRRLTSDEGIESNPDFFPGRKAHRLQCPV